MMYALYLQTEHTTATIIIIYEIYTRVHVTSRGEDLL